MLLTHAAALASRPLAPRSLARRYRWSVRLRVLHNRKAPAQAAASALCGGADSLFVDLGTDAVEGAHRALLDEHVRVVKHRAPSWRRRRRDSPRSTDFCSLLPSQQNKSRRRPGDRYLLSCVHPYRAGVQPEPDYLSKCSKQKRLCWRALTRSAGGSNVLKRAAERETVCARELATTHKSITYVGWDARTHSLLTRAGAPITDEIKKRGGGNDS